MARLCPFCKEEIKDDAIKCKHCKTFLYKIEASEEKEEPVKNNENESRYTTYIIDKDLIRFLKIALSLLAIFITMGIILYGVDLKQTVKDVNEANENLRAGNAKINSALPKMDTLEKQIDSVQKEVDKALFKANQALNEINLKRDTINFLVASIQLNPGQQTVLNELKNSNPELFRSNADYKNLWKSGSAIRIYFMDGTPTQKEKVKSIAAEWTRYANLSFDYVADKQLSQIRIKFNDEGSWSYVGTDCIAIQKDQPTMALGWVSENKETTNGEKGIILREFGFALGLHNEHQNSNATIRWDEAKVYKFYSGPPYYWDRASIYTQILQKYKGVSLKPFDTNSIMMLPVPKGLTLDGFQTGEKYELSEIDKLFIGKLYPKT